MSRPLQLLLILEDDKRVGALLRELRGGGFEPAALRVQTLDALRQALPSQPWDLLIADYHAPACPGLEALAAVRESRLDVPVLVITGAIDAEAAVAVMKAGAADLLTPRNLAQLVPTVERKLQRADSRRRAAQARDESEQRLRLAIELVQLGTFDWDMVKDRIYGDERLYSILGLPRDTVLGSLAECLGRVHPDDREALEAQIAAQTDAGATLTLEYRIVRPDGSVHWVASRAKTETDANGKPIRLVGVLQDINDLKSAEAGLRRSSERLHHLSRQLLAAQETERRQIAHELHDEIGQSLTAALIALQMAEKKHSGTDFAADLRDAAAVLETTLQQVRTMSLDLRPAMLDDLGLASALKWHVQRVAQRCGLHIQLSTPGLPERLPTQLETVCYRVVQETLTNIVRHARAADVRIEARRAGGELQLTIRDNGVGFDVAAAQARAQAGGSLGLLSMQERVALAGGELVVRSAPGDGSTISARLPLNEAAPPAEMMGED